MRHTSGFAAFLAAFAMVSFCGSQRAGAAPFNGPPPDSTLYSASRMEFGWPRFMSQMDIYFGIVFAEHFRRYKAKNTFYVYGNDVPGADAIRTEAWQKRAFVLTCAYRSPGEKPRREYYFWYHVALQSAQPRHLRSLHAHHPFLLIGAPRVDCPETEAQAHREVLRNFEPNARFVDAALPPPDLLEPPDELLVVEWQEDQDALHAANRFAGGDRAGLPFPILEWMTETVRRRVWILSSVAYQTHCANSQYRSQVSTEQLLRLVDTPEKLPEDVLAVYRLSTERTGPAWDAIVWARLAYCDFPVYLQELERFNDSLLAGDGL